MCVWDRCVRARACKADRACVCVASAWLCVSTFFLSKCCPGTHPGPCSRPAGTGAVVPALSVHVCAVVCAALGTFQVFLL